MSDKTNLNDLILYFVGRLQEEEADSLTTRLVKLLYLTDVEYYRSYGETATGLEWICYKYGPYVMEFRDIIQRLGLDIDYEEVITSAGYQGRKFFLETKLEPIMERLPVRIRLIADRLIRLLALESINTILDYVYFQTEPMQEVVFGDSLDFGKIERRPMETPIHVSLPRQQVEAMRARLRQSAAEIDQEEDMVEVPPYRDDLYFRTIAAMDST